jgi:hypothetical protein
MTERNLADCSHDSRVDCRDFGEKEKGLVGIEEK